MITTAIFDFDGTLADTAKGIIATTRETLKVMGLPQTTDEQICAAIGLPLAKCLQLGGSIPEERVDEAVATYRSLFFEIAPSHIVIFDSVIQTLEAMKARGIKMAIATSRSSNSLDKILEVHNLSQYFPIRITADMGISPKPAPDMVLECLSRLGSRAYEAIVIGDTTFDIEMGNGAGCITCGVTWGNHDRKTLLTSNPSHIIDTLPELLNII